MSRVKVKEVGNLGPNRAWKHNKLAEGAAKREKTNPLQTVVQRLLHCLAQCICTCVYVYHTFSIEVWCASI